MNTLYVGDGGCREFRPIVSRLCIDTRVTVVADLRHALRTIDTFDVQGEPQLPDIVLLAQSRPGEFAEASLDTLKRRLPLARFILLLGTWCEGESRTGRPWAGAERVYWYDWPARWSIQHTRVAAGRCPVWGLPETATGEERLLWSAETRNSLSTGEVIVHGRCRETIDAISDACRERGYHARPFSARAVAAGIAMEAPAQSGPRRAAAIWEGTQCDASEIRQLARFARLVGDLPMVALLDFPRADDVARAHASGVTSVVSKPYLIDELFWHLDRCIDPDRRQANGQPRKGDVAA